MFQDKDNFDDNPLAWFKQFQDVPSSSTLAQKGLAFLGLEAFYEAAANGTLPEISFIVGPAELSEHPPYMPKDGAWLQKKVVDAVLKSPKYSSTLLMISYDGMPVTILLPLKFYTNLIQSPRVWWFWRPRRPISLSSRHPRRVDAGPLWGIWRRLCWTR